MVFVSAGFYYLYICILCVIRCIYIHKSTIEQLKYIFHIYLFVYRYFDLQLTDSTQNSKRLPVLACSVVDCLVCVFVYVVVREIFLSFPRNYLYNNYAIILFHVCMGPSADQSVDLFYLVYLVYTFDLLYILNNLALMLLCVCDLVVCTAD